MFVDGRPFEQITLPIRVIGVLDGQVGQIHFAAGHARFIEQREFLEQNAQRPFVGGDVMRHEHEQMRTLLSQLAAACEAQESATYAGVAETLLMLMQPPGMRIRYTWWVGEYGSTLILRPITLSGWA